MEKETPEEKRARVLAKLNSEVEKCDDEVKAQERALTAKLQMREYQQARLDKFLKPKPAVKIVAEPAPAIPKEEISPKAKPVKVILPKEKAEKKIIPKPVFPKVKPVKWKK